MTTTDSWLPLAEYSIKNNVSISTLRRRIKTNEIKFKFDEGKYFLFDQNSSNKDTSNSNEPKQANAEEHRPSLNDVSFKNGTLNKDVFKNSALTFDESTQANNSLSLAKDNSANESVLTAANRLLAELKKAYTQSLQEKEKQIMALKQEVVDLKTLVKILES